MVVLKFYNPIFIYQNRESVTLIKMGKFWAEVKDCVGNTMHVLNRYLVPKNETKVVRIEIIYPNYIPDTEEVDIVVPVDLTEEEENKYIDQIVQRDYKTWY